VYANVIDSTGLNFKNAPVQLMSINNAETLAVTDITFDNTAGDGTGGSHNTDAFDIGSSTGVTITGAVIKNQDDCLAIDSGTSITFIGGSCSGGHGLSIGSIGGHSDNVVKTVNIESSSITDSQNGVRIKTVYGATGSVSGVTYKDITLNNISKYGIIIEQDYENGSPTGTPTTGVPITDLTISGVTGTVASSGTNVHILCGTVSGITPSTFMPNVFWEIILTLQQGACSGWTWTGNKVTGGKTSTACKNIPSGASC
jgi:galacturan 1,4-alpha-galacturonidase